MCILETCLVILLLAPFSKGFQLYRYASVVHSNLPFISQPTTKAMAPSWATFAAPCVWRWWDSGTNPGSRNIPGFTPPTGGRGQSKVKIYMFEKILSWLIFPNSHVWKHAKLCSLRPPIRHLPGLQDGVGPKHIPGSPVAGVPHLVRQLFSSQF